MTEAAAGRLTDLLAGTRRLALVGLAKNTGKTQTLAAILAEHAAAGRQVGVTSIGRDGEEHDVIDARIDKPRDPSAGRQPRGEHRRALAGERSRARAAGADRHADAARRSRHRQARRAGHHRGGRPEHCRRRARGERDDDSNIGAEQVLIDGAIDRRAASSPAVADGLVMATGAVLGEDIEQVVTVTKTRSTSSGCRAGRERPESRWPGRLVLERRAG